MKWVLFKYIMKCKILELFLYCINMIVFIFILFIIVRVDVFCMNDLYVGCIWILIGMYGWRKCYYGKKEVVLVFVKFFYFLYILKLNYDKNIEEFILSIF